MKYFKSALLLSLAISVNAYAQKNIGQIMMVGMKGTTVDDNSDIVKQMKSYNIGGIILFPKTGAYPEQNIENATQLEKLTSDLQGYAKQFGLPKLLIAVNQEGGQINGLKEENFPALKQCTNLSQADIGKTNDLALATKQSECIGRVLKNHGITVNMAPVAAIDLNPESEVIAKWGRSYGVVEKVVTDFVGASVKGYISAGITPMMKHFPGLGSAKANTDFGGMVNITNSWQKSEGNIYRDLIENNGVSPMIMVSFAMNTNLDKSGLPAALSYEMITNLLRDDMGYDGVVITDDMNATAIMDYFSRKQSTYLAVNAGNNMLIFGGGLGYDATKETDTLYQNLTELYARDDRFANKIDVSIKRIEKLKQTL